MKTLLVISLLFGLVVGPIFGQAENMDKAIPAYVMMSCTHHSMDNEIFQDIDIVRFDGYNKTQGFLFKSNSVDLDTVKLKAIFQLDPKFLAERDWLLNNKVWPIVSVRVKAIFDKLGLPYRSHPIEILDKANNLLATYFVYNIPSNKDAVDLERSEYKNSKITPNSFKKINRLVLHDEMSYEHIIRIEQKLNVLICSSELRSEIDKLGKSNFVFMPLNKYTSVSSYGYLVEHCEE